MTFTDVTSAMGWSGLYEHCACCADGCRMPHFAPCVDKSHETPQIPGTAPGSCSTGPRAERIDP